MKSSRSSSSTPSKPPVRGLRDGIDAESRRKLLRLLDAQNALLVEAKLMSFTAGFKLAAGIAGELESALLLRCRRGRKKQRR